jgi:diketogulonate reductase-like aldo/keto reductase
MYGNEAEVGAGLAASGIPRDEVFITTKVLRESISAKRMPGTVEESVRSLGVDQVDLLLIHWPNPSIPIAESMGVLSEMKRRGLARHIGVSNYTVALLDEAVRSSPEPIVVNQIEYHPFVDQSKLVAAIRRHGLAATAYTPIAHGRVVGNRVIEDIASIHGKTAVQVTLRWLIQQGVIAIPKSSHAERLKENLGIFDFALAPEEMEAIHRLGGGRHIINDRGSVGRWD